MRVLVVGGGPADSTAATAMAQAGLDVQLIESARFPRSHVGESLTPSCREVLEVIGVGGKADEHGFVIKHGGAFRWDDDKWVFDWGKQVGARSWQVTSDRLIGEGDAPTVDEGIASRSFAEIIAGLSDLREASDSSTRVMTEKLRDEALKVQARSLNDPGSARPDFTSVLGNPLDDAESADFRLVTAPRLGLERVRP